MNHTHVRPVTVACTNLKAGLRAGADLHLLPEILGPTLESDAPGLIGICEARWWQRGGQVIAEAERQLKKLYGCEYRLVVGGIGRSDTPPALAWRPDLFAWHRWNHPSSDHHRYSHNTAVLAWADAPEQPALRVQVAHLDYASGTQRLIEAEALAAQLAPQVTNVLMGDFNSALSGVHGGDCDWDSVPAHKRRHKARPAQDQNGRWRWIKDTRALDALTGPWDEHDQVRRYEYGPGYRALAELDWEQQGRPEHGLAATTTTDQPLPIDHILVDNTIDLDGFEVHVNPHSDHGLLHARTLVRPWQVPG